MVTFEVCGELLTAAWEGGLRCSYDLGDEQLAWELGGRPPGHGLQGHVVFALDHRVLAL